MNIFNWRFTYHVGRLERKGNILGIYTGNWYTYIFTHARIRLWEKNQKFNVFFLLKHININEIPNIILLYKIFFILNHDKNEYNYFYFV